MLNFIYARIIEAIGLIRTVLAQTSATGKRLDRIEQKVDKIQASLDAQAVILEKIQDELVPGPAVQLIMTAGPVEEQPQ